MSQKSSQMLKEAGEAATRVRAQMQLDTELYRELGARLRTLDPSFVGTVARGSSDHAANYATYLIPQCTGRLVASIPPSVVTVLESKLRTKGQFVLGISQSGSSPDIVGTLERARLGGALTAALVNDTNSALSRAAEFVLPQRAENETSVAATKTVLCTMTAIARLVGEWSQDKKLLAGLEELPSVLEKAFALGQSVDEKQLAGVASAFVLSRALGEGAAREIALKFKETCGIQAEGFSTAEVRHGPREIVDARFLVVGLALKGSGETHVTDAAMELAAQGAKVLLFGSFEKSHATPQLPSIELPTIEDSRLLPIVALQTLYPWIARCSVALGRDPDRPRHLQSKVVQTF
jgi:glucosamine--fructose-6-phosphate aminotransferase (isomerizing)